MQGLLQGLLLTADE